MFFSVKPKKILRSFLFAVLLFAGLVFVDVENACAETRTKTVEFFVGQNQTGGSGVAANTFWLPSTFTVNLPDAAVSASAIKSAWIEYTFQSAATANPGVVTMGLTPQGMSEAIFTSASYLSSGENYSIRVRGDFTDTVRSRIQSPGTWTFSYRARVAGVARKMENAKLFITYDYDSQAPTQIQTIRYRIGQSTGNVAVGATGVTFASPTMTVAENSPSVVSAWAEIRGQVPATGTVDNTFAVNYDSDSASNYYLDNAGGTNAQFIHILHSKPSITLNASHTLKVAATAGYQMNLLSAEQVITYTFDYSASTNLTTTQEVMLYSNGTRASSAPLDATRTITIPEDSPTMRNAYLKGTAHSVSSGGYGLAARLGSSTPTPSTTYTQTAATETLNNFWILSNDINDLVSMVHGDNTVSATFTGTMTSRAMLLTFTYTFAKSSFERSGQALYFANQQTAYGTSGAPTVAVAVAGVVRSGSYESYLQTDSVNGVTQDRRINISVSPTNTTAYNWNSSGEYQWIGFFHPNRNGEVSGSGTYTINEDSNGSNVMSTVLGVSWHYTGILDVAAVGSQLAWVSVPSTDTYLGGAFTFSIGSGTSTVTSIMITETGSVNAGAKLSNVRLFYESAAACSYDGTEAQFGTAQAFNSSEQATFNGSMDVGQAQVCVYVVYDVGNGVSTGETVDMEISSPSTQVIASSGSPSPSTVVAISGTTTLSAGTLSVDIVDASGAGTPSPSVAFAAKTFSWNSQQSTGILGTSSERIRVVNSRPAVTWTLSVAAAAGSASVWSSASDSYDFNDSAAAGRLLIDASGSAITPQSGCSATGLSKGSATYFVQEGQDSINLLTAGATAQTGCYWDLTGVDLIQDIPPGQPSGTYTIDMTVTIT